MAIIVIARFLVLRCAQASPLPNETITKITTSMRLSLPGSSLFIETTTVINRWRASGGPFKVNSTQCPCITYLSHEQKVEYNGLVMLSPKQAEQIDLIRILITQAFGDIDALSCYHAHNRLVQFLMPLEHRIQDAWLSASPQTAPNLAEVQSTFECLDDFAEISPEERDVRLDAYQAAFTSAFTGPGWFVHNHVVGTSSQEMLTTKRAVEEAVRTVPRQTLGLRRDTRAIDAACLRAAGGNTDVHVRSGRMTAAAASTPPYIFGGILLSPAVSDRVPVAH